MVAKRRMGSAETLLPGETKSRQSSRQSSRQRSVHSDTDGSKGGFPDHVDRYGITVLHPLKDSPSKHFVFDLIAIHGLNGHPVETWTHEQTRVMWLQDLLPDKLEQEVRIMTYGYDADIASFESPSTIRSIAKKLLCELMDVRRTEEVGCHLISENLGLTLLRRPTVPLSSFAIAWEVLLPSKHFWTMDLTSKAKFNQQSMA
ncbi:MAG: hypothetical protein Q9195_000070 [Heterodermia aff. obscurata]